MGIQMGRLAECGITALNVTYKWSDAVMSSFMRFELVLDWKGLATNFTNKRRLLCMRSLMDFDFVLGESTVFTSINITHKRLQFHMDTSFMSVKVAFLVETFATTFEWACKRGLPCMNNFMLFQIAFFNKCLVATFKRAYKPFIF
jgi:hypothetical protein